MCRCSICAKQQKIIPSIEYFMSQKHKYFFDRENLDSSHFCMWSYALDEYNMLRLQLKHFNNIERIHSYLNAFEGKTDESRMYYPPRKEKFELKIAFINMTK